MLPERGIPSMSLHRELMMAASIGSGAEAVAGSGGSSEAAAEEESGERKAQRGQGTRHATPGGADDHAGSAIAGAWRVRRRTCGRDQMRAHQSAARDQPQLQNRRSSSGRTEFERIENVVSVIRTDTRSSEHSPSMQQPSHICGAGCVTPSFLRIVAPNTRYGGQLTARK